METLYTALPFYDRLAKQCYQRSERTNKTGEMYPIKSACHRLPSFLINAETDAPGEIIAVDLIDIAGIVTDIMLYFRTTASYIQSAPGGGWTNGGYDTFIATPATTTIASAIKTTAAGEANCVNVISAGSVPAGITAGETLRIIVSLTLNSGTAPKIVLRNTGTGAAISNIITLINGTNFVFLTATTTLATGWAIYIYNSDTELSNWAATFTDGSKSVIPRLYTALTNDYFQYKGETLGILLPEGIYYLKITTTGGYIYYSDWFEVDCVYPNLINNWTNYTPLNGYETFTSNGTSITSAIETGALGTAIGGDSFNVIIGEKITVIFFLTSNSGQLPTLYLVDATWATGVSQLTVIGLNIIEFTSIWTGPATLRIQSTAAANFSTSETLVIRSYSEKYLTINFKNSCDIGDLLYEAGFEQTLFLNSEPMEHTYPTKEEGQENGEGKFVRTFARQVKKYNCKAGSFPDYMIDVFNRMKLYDDIELIDTVGNVNQVYNLEEEHEWLSPGKYYANINLTFDYDEAVVVMACCVNMSDV